VCFYSGDFSYVWLFGKQKSIGAFVGAFNFLADTRASVKILKITQIKFLFMCDFRDLCDLCDIHASMDLTFASGWTTPAGMHASRVPFWASCPNP
jgi:hypothetical protein